MMDAVARPWAPFALGLGVGTAVSVWGVVSTSWEARHNVQNPWDYESEYAKAYAEFQRIDWDWRVILGSPIALGIVVWVLWFVLSLVAGVGA